MKTVRIILTLQDNILYIQDFVTVLIVVLQPSNTSLERTHTLTLKHQEL
nr:MAG TPA: hypothetical protein [Caudoviricetes sp.]